MLNYTLQTVNDYYACLVRRYSCTDQPVYKITNDMTYGFPYNFSHVNNRVIAMEDDTTFATALDIICGWIHDGNKTEDDRLIVVLNGDQFSIRYFYKYFNKFCEQIKNDIVPFFPVIADINTMTELKLNIIRENIKTIKVMYYDMINDEIIHPDIISNIRRRWLED